MPRRKEYREMVARLKDVIDAILLHSEAVPPTKVRVFRMNEEMQAWLKAHADAAAFMLDWRMQRQLALSPGVSHAQDPAVPAPDPVPDADVVR